MAQAPKATIGSAIDQVLAALEGFDEKGQSNILSTVCAHLSLTLGSSSTGAQHREALAATALAHPVAAAPRSGPIDIRLLKEEKQPKNAIQMATVVAYYLSEFAPEEDRRNSITVEDVQKYFKQAKFNLPAKPAQLLVDTKGAGYFDSIVRGEYKLNSVGYNLVAHSMPTAKPGK